MPRAIGRFRTRHPDIQISYRPLPFDSLIPHVLLGHADLGITTMPPAGSSNLIAKEIGQGAIVCAIPRTHPLARKDRITADHLLGHTFIGYGKDTPFGHLTSPFLTSGSTQGEITPDIEIRSTPEAMAMVRQGVGVALVESHGYAQSGLEDVVLRPIHPALPHKIYLIHTRDNPLSKLAQGFLTNLKHVLQKDGPGEPGIK
jgi:DNA-binding transcriptional LysR family regulator